MLELNESNFTENTQDGVVVVDFYAPWCGPCKMLAPVLEQLENATVVKVNTDECQNLSVEHNVSALPTVVFFKNGKPVDRVVGVQSKDALQNKIDALLES